MSIGKRIKDLRIEKGLKQKELALEANIAQKNLSTYENELNIPPSDILKKIADALGVTSDSLLGSSSSELKNPEFVKMLNEIDKLPSKERQALLTIINTFLSAYKKTKKK